MKCLHRYLLIPIAGALAMLAGRVDVQVAPGTTVNSGKSQCKYEITGFPALSSGCSPYGGTFLCIELCTPPASKPPCNMAGVKTVDVGVILGKPPDYLTCDFTLTLRDCSVCDTSIPDGIPT